ncbi:hypothetical protein BGX28_000115 [Mortierella sp. GBA30]|nr:hypothetical protein BGX28_000115 [Mortierella sp. GBA30]
MASFMSMQYDSDSDSADDLDFEPASDVSSYSGDDSGSDVDDATEEVVLAEHVTTVGKRAASSSKSVKKNLVAPVEVSSPSSPSLDPVVPATTVSTDDVAQLREVGGEAIASTNIVPVNAPGGEEVVVKKKKGPKKGTKYKKRTPAVPADGAGGKAIKPPKMSKKAAAAAAAAAAETEAILQAQRQTLNIGSRFGSQVDMDHPLQTFKWPYSPFTTEFRTQHRVRDKMASRLHQQVQEITTRNGQAMDYLLELDNQVQMSRQDLRTSLDEIQFRKSQLRDMSLLAVDIVKKLSSSSSSSSCTSPSSRLRRRLSSSTASGNESGFGEGLEGEGGYASSCQTTTSHLDGDRMDVDDVESGGEQQQQYQQQHHQYRLPHECTDLPYHQHQHQHQRQHHHQRQNPDQRGNHEQLSNPNMEGLSEGNVRSFLEKIHEMEQAQRHMMV